MKKHKKHQWVKKEIKEVLTAWTTKTTEELSKELSIPRQSINYIVMRVRKLGYKVPRKRRASVIDSLIKEVLKEV